MSKGEVSERIRNRLSERTKMVLRVITIANGYLFLTAISWLIWNVVVMAAHSLVGWLIIGEPLTYNLNGWAAFITLFFAIFTVMWDSHVEPPSWMAEGKTNDRNYE